MKLVESRIALHGASLLNFNLTLGSEGLVTIDPQEMGFDLSGHTIRYNKQQGTIGVMLKMNDGDGSESLLAIGFIGHGCVIFDCLYFDSSLNPLIKLIAKIK